MKLSKLILLIFIISSNLCVSAIERDINWDNLNLTQNQKAKLEGVEKTWKQETRYRYIRLKRNKAALKKAILNYKASHQNIRALYVQIIHDESVLKDEAIECFLKKRSLLDTKQLKNLNKK